MKIRQRLALRFTFVSALVTGAILVVIYVVTQGFVHADFVERLTQQSRFEALHYAAPTLKDVMPEGSFMLVNPSISIYNERNERIYHKGDYQIDVSWIRTMKTSDVFNANPGEYTTVGRKYFINNRNLVVFVSDKDLPGQHELDLLLKAILIGWVLGLVFSYLAGLYFSGNALRPVKLVVNEVNGITKDNLAYRLKVRKDRTQVDEIDELVITFNALLARIETAFNAQKRFVQHASHELKTPMTAILAEAELALARDRDQADYKRTLSVIISESERLVTTTQGLLTLARLEEGAFLLYGEMIDVQSWVNNTIVSFQLHHPGRNLEVESNPPGVTVHGNTELLQLALLNILHNAVKYSSAKIILRILVPPDAVRVIVEDFGIGIPERDVERVRSPLFRGSNVGASPGAGLGLPLVDRIMRIHKGKLMISSVEGKGTTCELWLPLIRR